MHICPPHSSSIGGVSAPVVGLPTAIKHQKKKKKKREAKKKILLLSLLLHRYS